MAKAMAARGYEIDITEALRRAKQMSRAEGLNGQWIGEYTGTTSGHIHVNIDAEDGLKLSRDSVFVLRPDPQLPIAVAYFSTANKDPEFSFRTETIQAIDVATAGAVPWEDVRTKYPEGTAFSQYADVQGSVDENMLTMSWTTDIGVTGDSALPRSKADQPSELNPLELDWGAYKEHGIQLASKRPLFRGQE